MNDFVIKTKHVLWFPCTLGLTGRAFQQGQVLYHNIVDKRADGAEDPIDEAFLHDHNVKCIPHEFMKDIDNSLGAKAFANYMIGAIYDLEGNANGAL